MTHLSSHLSVPYLIFNVKLLSISFQLELILILWRFSFSGDTQNLSGRGPVQPAVGDAASAGSTEVPSNPEHSVILCDSVIHYVFFLGEGTS